ncbi:DUF4192 family protein [Nocardia abscessus]|uniref:DUF4192 family protein n=1 Tax=Nocardia abscessus TaxID=120957 RepID=UPI0024560767|nr:DUF4192 family protein [Nocardia abscessus]
MVAPVIPPQSRLQELASGPQVTNHSVRPRNGHIQYGLCTVGSGGRIVDRTVFTALDWQPGIRLELVCLDAGALLARPAPDANVVFAEGGYFRIPYRLRHRIGLDIGDRALLIAHHTNHQLLIHPPAVLDELCSPSLALASEAYLRGDGALARLAITIALEADPTHIIARLVNAALERALPPGVAHRSARFAVAAAADLGITIP